MAKQKYYVVWNGRNKGIFSNWEDCKTQIFEFPNAQYKSFETKALAELAFKTSKNIYSFKSRDVKKSSIPSVIGNPIPESISVDGAWNTVTGVVEYQAVYTDTKKLFFKMGPFEDGTNNIVEFLAIVHALALCKQHKILLPIYSDSRNAIGWVKNKKAKTNHKPSKKNITLFNLIERAEIWLNENTYENKILKWETKVWGENPADFGRK